MLILDDISKRFGEKNCFKSNWGVKNGFTTKFNYM